MAVGALLVALVAQAEGAARPALERGPFSKSVWVHANPWFPIHVDPGDSRGGPKMPWINYSKDEMWEKGFRLIKSYGVDGVVCEIGYSKWYPLGWTDVYRQMLDAAGRVGGDFRVGIFIGALQDTPEEFVEKNLPLLRPFKEDFRANPHMARIGNRPLVTVYTPARYTPEGWQKVFATFEAEFGPMAFLFNYAEYRIAGQGMPYFEAKLREYLPVFDGVTSYACWKDDVATQKEQAGVLKRVFADFPGKVFQPSAFSNHSRLSDFNAMEIPLSRGWRESVDLWLSEDPDAVMLTNLFDHFENSIVYPCYEREDLWMRYLQYALSKWRGSAFPKERTPELVLCNHVSVLAGWKDLEYEVLGFPIDAEEKTVKVAVQLCDTAGRVLKTLGPETMLLDEFRVVRFGVPSAEFVQERGVVPRLVYKWNGKIRKANYNPMTVISPSMRTSHEFWARSTKNELRVEGGDEAATLWELDGIMPGGTRVPRDGGYGTVYWGGLAATAKVDGDVRSGCVRAVLKRDFEEWHSADADAGFGGKRIHSVPMQNCGGSLHWYYLELENAFGRRFQTLPVWETDGARAGKVPMPVIQSDGTIVEQAIEGSRVPYFHYPMSHDDGQLVMDASGYGHNACVDDSKYFSPEEGLSHTGFNHYHNGAYQLFTPSLYRRDPDGTGYLHFDGTHSVRVMGGTAFPAASTYEVCLRVPVFGKDMGVFGTDRGQVQLDVLPDGRLRAARRKPPVKGRVEMVEVYSVKPLETNRWTRVAVVYDLRKLGLYVDGGLQGEVAVAPNRVRFDWGVTLGDYFASHEQCNHLMIGSGHKGSYYPDREFVGDLRDVRIYGRNLNPKEFLK